MTADVFDFTVEAPAFADVAQPGQFAQIRLPGHTLRRPISICNIDRDRGTLRFVFQVRGAGTEELSRYKSGDSLEILAPLGHGFPLDLPGRVLLVGGGSGTPPLLGVAAQYRENAVAVLGYRTASAVILEQDFRDMGAKTVIATDDGTYGYSGLVTDAARQEQFSAVVACGPLPMLRAARDLAVERGVPCYLSLEERMACGIGACLGCAVSLVDEAGQPYYGHVCKDGPVFPAEKVAL